MDDITNNPRITPLDIEQEMKKSFISYAMAVIINRALPDVRDGLQAGAPAHTVLYGRAVSPRISPSISPPA